MKTWRIGCGNQKSTLSLFESLSLVGVGSALHNVGKLTTPLSISAITTQVRQKGHSTQHAINLANFACNINIGDSIITGKTAWDKYLVGRVSSALYYDANHQISHLRYFRKINWTKVLNRREALQQFGTSLDQRCSVYLL